MDHIRNFSIIAHIDHGKSTLADRLLEQTGTIEKRKMRAQGVGMMDLERERGITIKMQPVRMSWEFGGRSWELNLIDTPGHIDFSYEVSRALKAVEGVILLVDATQGVQAQTLSVLALARAENLTIIPVVNKIDLPVAQVEATRAELAALLDCSPATVLAVSGKTGAGVPRLLAEIVQKIPPPREEFAHQGARGLVFDFEYSTHQGLIVYTRVTDGLIKPGAPLDFAASGESFVAQEVGIFAPAKTPAASLAAGEIGYIVTGLKKTSSAKVGDTIISPAVAGQPALPAFAGYGEPKPGVWASIYPENADHFTLLAQALGRLKLSDAAFSFEEESSSSLGRGFRSGFLGLLHLEIITERLRREFNLALVIATPTISYRLVDGATGANETVYSPHLFPDDLKNRQVFEPWARAKIILPPEELTGVIKLLNEHEANLVTTDNFGHNRVLIEIELPLRELMRNFFDEVKSVSSGFASFSYQLIGERSAEITRLDVLINDEVIPALSRLVAVKKVEREAREVVERLAKLLPRQLILIKIQARAGGRIIAAQHLSARRKDVTDYLYGGDITRKMKLREKQKKGKKKMQARGHISIPPMVFLKMVGSEH